MRARRRVYLSRYDEQTPLERFHCRSGALNLAVFLHAGKQPPGGGRKAGSLPLLVREADGQERRPQSAVDEGDFSGDEREGDDVAALGERRCRSKNLVRLAMRPPRAPNRLAGDDRRDAWQSVVGKKKQPAIAENSYEFRFPNP